MYNTAHHENELANFSFLITGGAGFIGSNLVEYLLKYKAERVVVLDNFSTGSRENLAPFMHNPAFHLIEGDIRDLDTCKEAMKGIDYVLHQAALGSVPRSIKDPITTNDVNINGFLNVLLAARDSSVKRFVYAASSSTYGDHPGLPKVEDQIGNPLSPYAVTKYVNELYANVFSNVYGFHSIGLRYFNVFGPRQNPDGAYAAVIPKFINLALNDMELSIYGDGNQSRDFTYIENVVQANIKAVFADGIVKSEVFNVAFGERTTLNNLVDHISHFIGRNAKVVYNDVRTGDIKHSLANIDKASNLLKYNPQFSFYEGLKETVQFFKEKQVVVSK